MNNAKDYYQAELLRRIMGYDPVLNLSPDYELMPREAIIHTFHTRNALKHLDLRVSNTKEDIRLIITDEYGAPIVNRSWHVIYDNINNEYAKLRSE